MIKNLAYVNIICGIIVLWTYLKSFPISYDYFFISGLVLTIWYNWETVKKLRGLKSYINKLNFIIGILLLPFSVLLSLSGILLFKKVSDFDYKSLTIFLGILRLVFGLLILLVTIRTLRFHKETRS